MKRTKDQVPLVVESHPDDYTGYPFITLLRYHKKAMLTIINNRDDNTVDAYVLDLCGPEHVDEEGVVAIAAEWYANNREKHPISVEFSRLGVSSVTCKIFRTFNVDFITRIIGPVQQYDTTPKRNARRRKRKDVAKNIKVTRVSRS